MILIDDIDYIFGKKLRFIDDADYVSKKGDLYNSYFSIPSFKEFSYWDSKIYKLGKKFYIIKDDKIVMAIRTCRKCNANPVSKDNVCDGCHGRLNFDSKAQIRMASRHYRI